jgi:hypothetical protein
MAREIRQFTATIPAGTPVAAPVRVPMAFPPRKVVSVEIRVPPGPSGLVGFALQISRLTVIPYQSDAFIVTSADSINWQLEGFADSGDWSVIGYNTGANDHAVYVRFLLDLVTGQAPPGVPMLDNFLLDNVGQDESIATGLGT